MTDLYSEGDRAVAPPPNSHEWRRVKQWGYGPECVASTGLVRFDNRNELDADSAYEIYIDLGTGFWLKISPSEWVDVEITDKLPWKQEEEST